MGFGVFFFFFASLLLLASVIETTVFINFIRNDLLQLKRKKSPGLEIGIVVAQFQPLLSADDHRVPYSAPQRQCFLFPGLKARRYLAAYFSEHLRTVNRQTSHESDSYIQPKLAED